jgi:3-hydroxyisobutyrate dehydrogenase/glyoxylate/succinic semialdehyde reductase
MKIGFIGLGIMGSRMAANLLRKGYSLVVYNRTAHKAMPLVEKGAAQAGTPAGVGVQADVLFTMLSDPQAVQEMAGGENGFLSRAKEGAIWVDCSTVNPSFSRQMADWAADRSLHFLDAPVFGSKAAAEKGELTFYVGGSAEDIETCKPYFEAMGSRAIHIGGQGMGSSIKLCFNLMLGQAMLGLSEAVHLGESLGFSRTEILNTLLSAPVAAPTLANKRTRIESGRYEPDFELRWMRKDLQLAAQTGYEQNVALPVTNAAKEVYALALQAGLGEEDYSAIFKFVNGLD